MKALPIQSIIALAISLTATARPPQGRGGPPSPPVPPLFAIFDTNHDQKLSAEEITAAKDALLKLDQNQDGEVSLLESLMPPPDERKPRRKPNKNNDADDGKGDRPAPQNRPGPPPKRPMPPVVQALDLNRDGSLTPDELASAPESLKTLDQDGDGTLSPEELRPQGPPPPMGENPPVE